MMTVNMMLLLLLASALVNASYLHQLFVSKPGKFPAAASRHRFLEFGDYAEVPDECPATTSCPAVCVANITDCPTTCDDGLELCDTGVCLPDCSVLVEPESPCACESLPIACAKPVDVFTTCFERFQAFYDVNTACVEAQEEAIPQVSFVGPYFVACYSIVSGVSLLVFLWGIYNQRMFPVKNSMVPLTIENSTWTLTGYRTSWLGNVVYALVLLVLFGIQFLLFVLVIMYYMQQEAITRWAPVFQDEVQVLKAFIIVWMVGFFWSFAFRYPTTGIRNLFLRRCTLDTAEYVVVVAPIKSMNAQDSTADTFLLRFGDLMTACLWCPLNALLRFIFSWPYGQPGVDATFCPIIVDLATGRRSFYHRMRRYVYEEAIDKDSPSIDEGNNEDAPFLDEENGSVATPIFVPGTIQVGERLGDFLKQSQGLSTDEVVQRTAKVGPNFVPMDRPTILGSIRKEFGKPFYLYQNFMVWTWAPYWYYYMAIVNTVVRVTGGIVVGFFQYLSDSVLYKISHVGGEVVVLRDGEKATISNADVVPGDVVVLSQGLCYCDMVVVKADHIVVDESALTGEATPIVKTEIDSTMSDTVYDPRLHKSHTLSAGTEILEVGESDNDLGLVLTTGSFTTKGQLLTDILAYQRHKFKFDDEVKIVLIILVLYAIFLLCMVFYFLKEQWVYAWFYGVFVLGTVIPPLLPTVFVVSVGISADRLRKNKITCTYPEGILVAGKVNMAFFDKTGTLTKQGMDFISLDGSDKEKVRLGMAVCHSLSTTSSGEILGNHVDQVSFEATGAVLDHKIGEATRVVFEEKRYTILKDFAFDNHRATQSVIVEDEAGNKQIFVKGSPEAIKALCIGSTIPKAFEETVQASAKTGVYQLAMAFKEYALSGMVSEVLRDDVEMKLTFVGFVNFQNVMKEDTPAVMKELEEGNVNVAMITGDSVLTGICIAKEAGMIKPNRTTLLARKSDIDTIEWVDSETDEVVRPPSDTMLTDPDSNIDLAVSGKAWIAFLEGDPKFAVLIAKHVKVFGRCNPSEKVAVVSHFVERGYKTLMCGDGSNDCGSLKAAHVGIALSSSEASVVAPFTSLDKTITSVTEVLREGRCALASAFAAYSYYIIYGQVESLLQTINAYFAITFTEWCWVFLDGVWSIIMAFTLPLAKAAKKLSPTRPTASLLGPRTMFSVCGMLAWNLLFIVIALLVLFHEDWFQCRKWNSDDVSNIRTIGDNYETSVLFLVGGYQYICSAIALNFGYTWREAWIRNYVFVFFAILFTVFQIVVTMYPSVFSCIWRVNCNNEDAVRWVTTSYPVAINNAWNTTVMPVPFRWKMMGVMAGNLLALCVWQYYFVNGWLARKVVAKKKGYIAAEEITTAEEIAAADETEETSNDVL